MKKIINLPAKNYNQIDTTKIEQIENEITNFELKRIEITDENSYLEVSNNLKQMKNFYRQIESEKKIIEEPFKLALEYIRENVFKPMTYRLEKLEDKMKENVKQYVLEQEKKRRETEKAFNEQLPEGTHIIMPNNTPKVSGVVIKEIWKFEIVDETLLPREYLIPDETKIRKIVNTLKEETNIPGVRVHKEKVVSA